MCFNLDEYCVFFCVLCMIGNVYFDVISFDLFFY